MKISSLLASALLITLGATRALAAGVQFEHVGSADPVTEGWSATVTGLGVSIGPVTNDLGLGIDAWSVADSSTVVSPNSTKQYQVFPDPAQIAEASSKGWRLSTTIRMLAGNFGSFESIITLYQDGTTSWGLRFDAELDGDPVVTLTDGQTFVLQGVGDQSYHTYSLVYDPDTGTADLFVDGVERISDTTGVPASLTRITWGAGASDGTGHGHFSSVSWRILDPVHAVPALSPPFVIAAAVLMTTFGWRLLRKVPGDG